MHTKNLKLLPSTPAQLLALIEGADAYEKLCGLTVATGLREFAGAASPEFRAKLESATSADPWRFGFFVVHRADNVVIGMCGFKGPPGPDHVVELAYGIAPNYQGRGYATEVALALVAYAVESGVRTVRAHTLPELNASTSVLRKAGFIRVGEVIDPEDGLVWQWETTPGRAQFRPSDAAQDDSG